MSRLISYGILVLVLTGTSALAKDFSCDANSAWLRVRQAYPFHSQTLAECVNKRTGEHVIVLTEPPPHFVRANADAIVKALFSVPVISVQRKRHALGFNGWTEDLVIVVRSSTAEQDRALNDDLALLSMFAFGSDYKTEVEDIARLAPPAYWDAPPAVEVTADELFSWLLGPNAEKLVPLDGGDAAGLQERAARKEIGTYQSATPGLVVTLLPSGASADLNDFAGDLRRFAVDSDTFIGALRFGEDRVALIGRERTAPAAAVPPLRVETLLLLASFRGAQLSQSYERNRAFAGKLLSRAGDLFGWDWAPVFLSTVLIDTELGSVLNLTDDMLKGWSESGKVEYRGFSYGRPKQFPFGDSGAFKLIGSQRLVYNWNTAGVGYVSTKDSVDVYVVRNTGSLPVSYFPEGSQSDRSGKAKLVRAEDAAYKYFRTQHNPLLGRAVQYAALYQVFQAFDIAAKPPADEAPSSAAIGTVEDILEKDVKQALDRLSSPSTPSTADLLLSVAYDKFGAKGQEFEFRRTPAIDAALKKLRIKLASKIAQLDREMPPGWRDDYSKALATGLPMPDDMRTVLKDIDKDELPLVLAPEQVREEVLSATERDPMGWIRTPSIVVSRNGNRELTGGHNIGGEPTRIELDPSIAKGEVEESGDYESGRVLRINPADAPLAPEIVRTFDREVGIDDDNVDKGLLAVEAKLHEAQHVTPPPPRPMAAALELDRSPARVIRGAQPSQNAMLVGYRPGPISGDVRSHIEAIAQQSQAQVVVARVDDGYVIRSAQADRFTLAPNPTSLARALQRELQAASGQPSKIVFDGLTANEVELTVRNVRERLRAAGGAGGKPPFGGGRMLAAFDDGKEPGSDFWHRKPIEVIVADKKAIHVTGTNAELVLNSEPQWAAATVNVRSPGSVLFANAPDFGGADTHMVEVSLPVADRGGRLKRIFINAIGAFRRLLTGEERHSIDAAVTKVFKPTTPIDVRAALIRYKSLMTDDFNADNVWIQLREEGADVIVTEAPAATSVTQAPPAAPPRG